MKLRVIIFCAVGGIPLLIGAMADGRWAQWWLAGVVLALPFIPVAMFGSRTGAGQFAAIATALLVVTSWCTWSEALLFVPNSEVGQHPWKTLIGGSVLYLFVAAVLAIAARLLRLNRESSIALKHRGFSRAALALVLCGIAYVVYYGIFGAITYQYFTYRYYPEAAQHVAKLGLWFWAIQFVRGVAMTLAILPILYTLRMRRTYAALVVGAVIWIAGGLAPLLMPNPLFGWSQRVIHIVEIFTQNFTLGVTAVLLFRSSDSRETLLPEAEKPLQRTSAAGN